MDNNNNNANSTMINMNRFLYNSNSKISKSNLVQCSFDKFVSSPTRLDYYALYLFSYIIW